MNTTAVMDDPVTPTKSRLDQLAEAIAAEHRAVGDGIRTSLEHAHAAGVLLLEAKALVPHGMWLAWVREHCAISARQVQKYERLAESWGALQTKASSRADLTLTRALALLADTVVDDDDDDHGEAADDSGSRPSGGFAASGRSPTSTTAVLARLLKTRTEFLAALV